VGVVDAEGLPPVFTHVRVNPGDVLVGVTPDHVRTQPCPLRAGGDVQAVREGALHDVPRHLVPPSSVRVSRRTYAPRPGGTSAELPSLRPRPTDLWRRESGRDRWRSRPPVRCGKRADVHRRTRVSVASPADSGTRIGPTVRSLLRYPGAVGVRLGRYFEMSIVTMRPRPRASFRPATIGSATP